MYLTVARTIPLVDNLVIIRYRKNIAEVVASKCTHESILCGICVLKLINKPIWIGPAISRSNGWIRCNKPISLEYLGIEVQGINSPKLLLVNTVCLDDTVSIRETGQRLFGSGWFDEL